MTSTDWLWILHPALAMVVIYPLLGMVVRLAWSIRRERSAGAGPQHGDLGRWLATAVVLLVLTALTVVIVTKEPPDRFAGGPARAAELLLVLLGTLGSLSALWRCRPAAGRLGLALLSWAGVLLLGAQPEVWRLSDDPLSLAFWQSHYWAGVALTGLMLFSLGAWPEIQRQRRLRRLHVSASVLAALLFCLQGITGTRDLLEIPLSWQKPAVYACDFTAKTCPPPAQAAS